MLRKIDRNPEPGIQGNVREGSFCLIKTDALMFLPRSFSHVKVMSVDNGHYIFAKRWYFGQMAWNSNGLNGELEEPLYLTRLTQSDHVMLAEL